MANGDAARTYAHLMKEVKFRIEAISDILNGKVRLRGRIAEETCYLQLRMICETMAIGCLVMHGDLGVRKDAGRSFKADWIMKLLDEAHSDFFPKPIMAQDAPGDPPQMVPVPDGFFTKEEFKHLYANVCGNAVHRGSMNTVMGNERPTEFDTISEWLNKIVRLLNRHTILTPDKNSMAVFAMEDGKGEVSWTLFKMVS